MNGEEETEAGIVYTEIHGVVKRYLSEGDKLTAFGVLGALEAVKADVLDMITRHNAGDSNASQTGDAD
jgi:hypothetical protein